MQPEFVQLLVIMCTCMCVHSGHLLACFMKYEIKNVASYCFYYCLHFSGAVIYAIEEYMVKGSTGSCIMPQCHTAIYVIMFKGRQCFLIYKSRYTSVYVNS